MTMLLVWEQPTFRSQDCAKCGAVALSEVAVTYQSEPDSNTRFYPLCFPHGKEFAAAARLAAWLQWVYAPIGHVHA